MKKAILWRQKNTAHGPIGYDGIVGEVTLFSYGWAGGPEPYVLHTQLPGYQSRRWRKASEQEARDFAERVFAKWLATIGASLTSKGE